MKGLLILDSVGSTQSVLEEYVRVDDRSIWAVLANEQTHGRGRLGRNWHSPPHTCLALSMALWDWAGIEHPELAGMSVAAKAAGILDCNICWPNDLMLNGKKLGGVITEMVATSGGQRVPIVGIGANLFIEEFPEEIASRATSLFIERNVVSSDEFNSVTIAQSILFQTAYESPPRSWIELESLWMERDCTPGKNYQLPDGSIGEAVGINDKGWLIAKVNNQTIEVPSAEAWFGN